MGEGTSGDQQLDELSERIERSQASLDGLVTELDERRHVAAKLRRTLSEHRLWALAAGIMGLGLAGGAIALAVRHQRQKPGSLRLQAARLRRAAARVIDAPDDRGAPIRESLTAKVLTAAASAAAGLVVKRLFDSVSQPGSPPKAASHL